MGETLRTFKQAGASAQDNGRWGLLEKEPTILRVSSSKSSGSLRKARTRGKRKRGKREKLKHLTKKATKRKRKNRHRRRPPRRPLAPLRNLLPVPHRVRKTR